RDRRRSPVDGSLDGGRSGDILSSPASARTSRIAMPHFIVLEGLDGAGKTTQARLLKESLISRDWPVHYTTEPSTSPFGCRIREVLGREETLDERDLALMFAA